MLPQCPKSQLWWPIDVNN